MNFIAICFALNFSIKTYLRQLCGWNGYENYDDLLFESPKSISSLDYDEIYSDDNMKPSDRNVPNVPEYYFENINNHEEMLEFTQYNNGNWGCSGQASFYDLIGRERK